MSAKLCCLCCTSCVNEYEYLQNDTGECNELYEITVKYFDPMLLTEHINTPCCKDADCSILCQNCWAHIKDFHSFQQTVITARTSLEWSYACPVEKQDYNDFGNEELVELQQVLNTKDFEENFETRYDCEEQVDDDKPVRELRSQCKTNKETYINRSKEKTNYLANKNVQRCKTGSSKKSCKDSKTFGANDTSIKNVKHAKGKNIKKYSQKEIHPALDKGREYDKFIAEWKSQLECEICNEVFPIFDLLKLHFKDKHKTRAFVKCCDRKFDRRCSLVEHIRLHINPEMHKCDICGKLSGSKYSLIHHKKTIHEESQKFKCSECPKIFKQKQNLKCHLLTHVTGNKDFKCNECDKTYVLELQLKKHIKLVHIDNRICDQCGKTLHGIGALKNHLKEHADIEKPKYPCDECGAELGSRITLKRHKASYHNDGSTVYVCSLCGKVSSTERALKNHKKYVHEIERKYKCPHCDKAFKRSQNLQEHIATHTGEALYQCAQCPRSFKINSKYHEHRKKAHPIEWEAGRKNRLEKQKIDYERVTNQVVL